MDFTLKRYRQLLDTLRAQGYVFRTFAEFLERPEPRCIILRHDVEARYANAMVMAKIQKEAGIKGSYYFRFLPDHFDTGIIREIAEMGHEIGYHYDDLSHCKGDYEKAIRRFERNLATLREIAPVKTICMEGAPLSKYDNRLLWSSEGKGAGRLGGLGAWGLGSRETGQSSSILPQNNEIHASTPPSRHAHYSAYGIIGEPYFDIDFSKVFYLTDTGRRWDGKGSVRDRVGGRRSEVGGRRSKVEGRGSEVGGRQAATDNSTFNIQHSTLRSTRDIIAAAGAGLLPDQIMFTFHPQRWSDQPLPWFRELVMQNVKNLGKRIILNFKF